MKASLAALLLLAAPLPAFAQAKKTAPNLLAAYLVPGEITKAELVVVEVPTKELEPYMTKLQAAAEKDPEWYKEYSKALKPGLPFPYHEKMGLTKEEHAAYLKLWDQRAFKVLAPVEIRLIDAGNGQWRIQAVGPISFFSTLKYSPAKDTLASPNGTLARLPDVKADPLSLLGAWTGHEWSFHQKDDFSTIKENFSIGTLPDKKHAILIYRFQELTSLGRPFQKGALVRFPLKKK